MIKWSAITEGAKLGVGIVYDQLIRKQIRDIGLLETLRERLNILENEPEFRNVPNVIEQQKIRASKVQSTTGIWGLGRGTDLSVYSDEYLRWLGLDTKQRGRPDILGQGHGGKVTIGGIAQDVVASGLKYDITHIAQLEKDIIRGAVNNWVRPIFYKSIDEVVEDV